MTLVTRVQDLLRQTGFRPLTTSTRLSIRAAFCLTVPLVLGIVLHQRAYSTAVALGTLWGVSQDGSDRWRQRGPRLLGVSMAGGVGLTIGSEFLRLSTGDWAVVALLAVTAFLAGIIEASMFATQGMYLLLGTIVGEGLGFTGREWQSGVCIGAGALWVYFVASITDRRSRTVDQRATIAHAFRQLARSLQETNPERASIARVQNLRVLDVAQEVVGVEPLDKQSAEVVALRQCLVVALQVAETSWFVRTKDIAVDPVITDALDVAADILRYKDAVSADRYLRTVQLPSDEDQKVVVSALRPPDQADLRPGLAFRSTLTRLPWSDRLRFALILTVAVAGASVLTHWIDGPRGYWLPMSVAFIFRPDLGPVVRRALSRTVGTLVGVGIAAIVALSGNQISLLIVLVFLMAWAVPWAKERSHALTMVFFTPIIFVFVSLLGPDQNLFGPRILDTALGAAIVFVIDYFFWLHAPSLRPRQLTDRARQETENYEEIQDLSDLTLRHLRRRRAIRTVTQARAAVAQAKSESHAQKGLDVTLDQELNALESRIDLHTLQLIEKSLER